MVKNFLSVQPHPAILFATASFEHVPEPDQGLSAVFVLDQCCLIFKGTQLHRIHRRKNDFFLRLLSESFVLTARVNLISLIRDNSSAEFNLSKI